MTDRYKEAIQGARDCVERNKDGGVYIPDLLRVIDSQQAEIERLQQETKHTNDLRLEIFENKRAWERLAKSKAIKEFAERLKNNDFFANFTYKGEAKLIIDNLVKEMVGDDK